MWLWAILSKKLGENNIIILSSNVYIGIFGLSYIIHFCLFLKQFVIFSNILAATATYFMSSKLIQNTKVGYHFPNLQFLVPKMAHTANQVEHRAVAINTFY